MDPLGFLLLEETIKQSLKRLQRFWEPSEGVFFFGLIRGPHMAKPLEIARGSMVMVHPLKRPLSFIRCRMQAFIFDQTLWRKSGTMQKQRHLTTENRNPSNKIQTHWNFYAHSSNIKEIPQSSQNRHQTKTTENPNTIKCPYRFQATHAPLKQTVGTGRCKGSWAT